MQFATPFLWEDADTLAAISGGIAEAMFGIPADLIEEVQPFLKGICIGDSTILERLK